MVYPLQQLSRGNPQRSLLLLFGPGTTVNVQCKVTYPKHLAIESCTLFKAALDSEYKIAGHQFALEGFLKEGRAPEPYGDRAHLIRATALTR